MISKFNIKIIALVLIVIGSIIFVVAKSTEHYSTIRETLANMANLGSPLFAPLSTKYKSTDNEQQYANKKYNNIVFGRNV